MQTTDAQVLRLRAERARGRSIEGAAMKSGMHRNTARKYLSGPLPSERETERTWRTREDPFAEDWPAMAAMLEEAPGLEAKALFEHWQALRPGRYPDGHLRTFQRRVKGWRATRGPEKEVFFPQAHRPGEALQTDFTYARVLDVTIGREPYDHLLCVTALPYSRWRWATPCRSESMAALSEGLQNAVFELGRVPRHHQTDHSTAATHHNGGAWVFHDEYAALMRHLGMEPRLTGVGKKEQNGSVEAGNGALKRELEQELLLRGHRDFESQGAYRTWLEVVLRKRNRRRSRLAEELSAMRPLSAARLPAYVVVDARVGSGATIRAKSCTYSVPSRLIGEKVRVRVYESRLEVYLGGQRQVTLERVRGKGAYRVSWRHVIGWMVKKPGAFRRYRYRDALFPTPTFRQAWEALDQTLSTWSADMNYLQVLLHARDGCEHDVERALKVLSLAGEPARFERVVALTGSTRPARPEVEVSEVELSTYDGLTPEASAEATR